MRVVFLGPPGAGKGTQACILSKKLGVPQLSTGDIFRDEVVKCTDIGIQIKDIIDSGRLVSNNVVNQVVYNRIRCSDCVSGFVLDGYPRTIGQAMSLQVSLAEMKCNIDAVIELVVDDDAMFRRIEDRVTKAVSADKSVRSDDKYDVFLRRIKDYRTVSIPITDYYKSNGLLYTVDGMLDVGLVSKHIDSIIASVRKKCCNG
ncbi:MAG: adenylate kinase [Candidatus Liberibacter europaeus]|uniref:Adenylate kinase n=1 Tax=Candidatus Liberibacter europaeus TaxID=744859 RepID=A0A2T4VY50_9HYPH|nr:adenylate kinase [Candidatus Liberibacter europaeus]PTL86700.1 MAG: adenylate kinase [Candidatus Liberibacter europaeus]